MRYSEEKLMLKRGGWGEQEEEEGEAERTLQQEEMVQGQRCMLH